MIPIQLLVVWPRHHVVNAILTLHTTLTTATVRSIVALIAALAAAPHLIHPAMIAIMMIAAAADPLVNAMNTKSDIMISLPIL